MELPDRKWRRKKVYQRKEEAEKSIAFDSTGFVLTAESVLFCLRANGCFICLLIGGRMESLAGFAIIVIFFVTAGQTSVQHACHKACC
jgi:hypothetical protein